MESSAIGKIILFGEHSVVYGKPAIAVPVRGVSVMVNVVDGDYYVSTTAKISGAEQDNLDALLALVLDRLGLRKQGMRIRIASTIQPGSGLGSSASLSVALIRAISAHNGIALSDEEVSSLSFECERIFHGNPSGIDNTVIAFEKPVYYMMGEQPEILPITTPFKIIIADTGIRGSTKDAVTRVRRGYESDQEGYENIFSAMGQIALRARDAVMDGDTRLIGSLMGENHSCLQRLYVSSPELDRLAAAAAKAGAYGAKLAGGGLGGNIVAVAPDDKIPAIKKALAEAGAAKVIISEVS